MRGCAPRTRGRGDPCTRYTEKKIRCGTSSLLELFRLGEVDLSGKSTARPSRPRAQPPNRDEVPHLFLLILGAGVTPAAGVGRAAPHLIPPPPLSAAPAFADVEGGCGQRVADQEQESDGADCDAASEPPE